MDTSNTVSAPDAVMLMGTTCPYCPTVLKALQALLDAGQLNSLQTWNIEEHPEIAQQYGVRSVPWVRIGDFELEGLRSEKELGEWAAKAAAGAGIDAWLEEQLGSGRLDAVLEKLRADATVMDALLALFTEADTELNIRIGISAVMEHLEGSEILQAQTARLGALTQHAEARVRGDACHYLALGGDPAARQWVEPLLKDSDENVRDVARESLETLQARNA